MNIKYITLHELVLRIMSDYNDLYNERLKVYDYYMSWNCNMVVLETAKGKYLFNYKNYLLEGEEVDDNDW